jgi:hypothetical protein
LWPALGTAQWAKPSGAWGRGQAMPGMYAAGTLAVPIWLAGAAAVVSFAPITARLMAGQTGGPRFWVTALTTCHRHV